MSTALARTTGRRKRSTARVILREGEGKVTVNGKDVNDYFFSVAQRSEALRPLKLVGREETYDISAKIVGGGLSGQAGALRMGIARALVETDSELRTKLKTERMLTRDDRKKESKKYGLKKARKASQYSKR